MRTKPPSSVWFPKLKSKAERIPLEATQIWDGKSFGLCLQLHGLKCTSSQRVTYPCVNKLPKQSRLDHVWLVGTSVQPQPSISAVFRNLGLTETATIQKLLQAINRSTISECEQVIHFRLKQVHTLTICELKIQKIVQTPARESNTHTRSINIFFHFPSYHCNLLGSWVGPMKTSLGATDHASPS